MTILSSSETDLPAYKYMYHFRQSTRDHFLSFTEVLADGVVHGDLVLILFFFLLAVVDK